MQITLISKRQWRITKIFITLESIITTYLFTEYNLFLFRDDSRRRWKHAIHNGLGLFSPIFRFIRINVKIIINCS